MKLKDIEVGKKYAVGSKDYPVVVEVLAIGKENQWDARKKVRVDKGNGYRPWIAPQTVLWTEEEWEGIKAKRDAESKARREREKKESNRLKADRRAMLEFLIENSNVVDNEYQTHRTGISVDRKGKCEIATSHLLEVLRRHPEVLDTLEELKG